MVQNTDLNQVSVDAQYKDSSPIATVQHIKGILSSYSIETTETWIESSVPHCHTVRVQVVGTTFGTNGKGLTREFALASGYGELMERLQIGSIYKAGMQKDGTHSFVSGEYDSVSIDELLSKNGKWYQALAQKLQEYAGVSMSPKDILKQFSKADGTMEVTPYFSLTTGKWEQFPNALRGRIYTTNGCAAGNSAEETLVQAISEIVERHHMFTILHEGYSLPDIPEDVLKQCKTAYDIITYTRNQGYRVILKDCSLGQKFPVVCAIIIDERTGRYHTHFGAYPIFEIALERSLTESFQGRNIRNIAHLENFLQKKPGEFSFVSISNELVKGKHEKTTGFFAGNSKYEYNKDVGFTGGNNRTVLRECVAFFKEQGYDILVLDRSCLGFHTYQVLIPGFSEAFVHRLCDKMNEHRYAVHATKVLRNPSAATLPDLLGLLMHVDEMGKYTSNIESVHGFMAGSRISANISPREDKHLMSSSLAYVYYALGKYNEVVKCLNAMIPACDESELEFLICLKRYLTMKLNRCSPEHIKEVVEYFHRPETVAKLYGFFSRNANPLDEFTIHCDLESCEGCRLQKVCCQKRTLELAALLKSKYSEMDSAKFEQEMMALL